MVAAPLDEADLVLLAGRNDPLVHVLDQRARTRGLRTAWLDLPALAIQVEIVVSDGVATVSPTKPLLVRPLPSFDDTDDDTRFHWGERFAAAWSYAALNPSPVLNRPNEWGWSARASYSGSLTEFRLYRDVAATETFWYGRPPELAEPALHQELHTWQRVDTPDGERCIRSRSMPECVGWDQVIVVGQRGFRVTDVDIGSHDLEHRSVVAASALGLTFATVSWGIRRDGRAPILARINPFPSYYDVEPVGADAVDALIDELMKP